MAKIDSHDSGSLNTGKTADDTKWEAMVFTTTSGYTIKSVSINIYKGQIHDPGGLTVSIRAVDGDNRPTGSDLCSGRTNGNTLGASDSEWRYIDFGDGTALANATKYAIILRSDNDAGASYNVAWYTSSDSYTSGGGRCYSTNSGSSWAYYADDGLFFRTYDTNNFSSDVISSDKTYTKKLVALANSSLWYESSAGAMTDLADSGSNIDTSSPIDMAELNQKIFVVNGTNLGVADFVNTKITTDDPISGGGSVVPTHGTVLTDQSSGAEMIVDFITASTDGSACTIYGYRTTTATFSDTNTVKGTVSSADDVEFDLNADEASGPFWYDWTVYGADTTTYGTMPDEATLVCNYRGRPVLAGNTNYPHQWYMGRQGNPWDFAYTANDAQAPVAGNNADAGEVGDIITSLIPYKDDFLVFGCAGSIWYLAGDPAAGGSLNELDLTTGIFGAKSWCFDGAGNLYFWGTNGIYRTTIPGTPECISEVNLPNLVGDETINNNTHRVTMSYDIRRSGIHICITQLSDGDNSNYWYDLRTEGFFPESYPNSCGVFSMYNYNADDPDYRKLVLGCNDGYLRYFDETEKSDVGTSSDVAIDSYVTFGPIGIGEDSSGVVNSVNVVTAGGGSNGSQSDSDSVTMKLFTANTAEGLLEKLSADTGPRVSKSISLPKQRLSSVSKRRIRGAYAGLRLENDTVDESWGLEKLVLKTKPKGRIK